MEQKNILNYETVALDSEKGELVIINQTKLPYDIEILRLNTQKQIWDAIYRLHGLGRAVSGRHDRSFHREIRQIL